ncbi:hypothetical protein ACFUIZ_08695 [Streptomyces cinereoruber]|uniref:hypothetical protein n=1 Tax=Streptomyces cinereoruber TaxID=67260 RepID=UPI00362BBE06
MSGGRRTAGEALLADVGGDGAQTVEEDFIDATAVGAGGGDLVPPVGGLAVLAQGEVAQVETVGGDPVSDAVGQLPPELGAFGVACKEEEAGEDGGVVLAELAVGATGGGVGQAADVAGDAGGVDGPPAYGRESSRR